MNKIKFSILSLNIFFYSLFAGSPNDQYLVEFLDDQLSNSNHYRLEYQNNQKLTDIAQEFLKRVSQEILNNPESRMHVVSIMLKLGNIMLTQEEPLKAIDFYQRALALYEDETVSLHQLMPVLQASLFYGLSRAIWYHSDHPNQRSRAKEYCLKALKIVQETDHELPRPDKHQGVRSEELYTIFLAQIFMDEGMLDEAESYLENLPSTSCEILDILKTKQFLALKVKQKKFKEAALFVERYLRLLNIDGSELSRQGMQLVRIADFYLDSDNPYRNLFLAERFLLEAKEQCPKSFQYLCYRIAAGLSQIQKERAQSHLEVYYSQDGKKALETTKHHDEIYLLSFERLGDISFYRNDKFSAVVMYTHALTLANKEDQERIEKKLDLIEPNLSGRMKQYRKDVLTIRQKVKKKLPLESARQLTIEISSYYVDILRQMFIDATQESPIAVDQFAFVAYGSIARQMATHYSDIECVFLTSAKIGSDTYNQCLKTAERISLYLALIGETPATYIADFTPIFSLMQPSGIRLDPGLQKRELKIPVISLTSLNEEADASLQSSLRSSRLIIGNQKIVPPSDDKNPALFTFHLSRCNPLQFYEDVSGTIYSLKHDIYRPLIFMLDGLSTEIEPNKQINQLEEKGVLAKELADRLRMLVESICSLRLTHYEEACEQVESIPGIEKDHHATLVELYQICLQHTVETPSGLFSDENPSVAKQQIDFGVEKIKNREFDKGRTYLEKALSIYERIDGPYHLNCIEPLKWIGHIEIETGDPRLALYYLDRCQEILNRNNMKDLHITKLINEANNHMKKGNFPMGSKHAGVHCVELYNQAQNEKDVRKALYLLKLSLLYGRCYFEPKNEIIASIEKKIATMTN